MHKLSKAEQNYSTYDRELLAVFAAIKYFEHLVGRWQFIIKTDHKPLTYAFAQKSEKASPRQARQLCYISQFTTSIVHIKGDDNIVADTLSRIYTIDMPTTLSAQTIQEDQEVDEELINLVNHPPSLKLQKITVEPDTEIYCDISTGIVRP